VKGTSAKGHGVIGTTKSKGSTGSNSHAGVFGQDLQNNIGSFLNSGVEGTSNYGFGVFGQALNGIGVRGEGFNGMDAEGGPIGLFALSSQDSVLSEIDGSGDAFLAQGNGGILFRGNNSNSVDAFVVDDAGDISAAGTVNAANDVQGLEGLFGSQSISGQGVVGASASEGVEGQNSTTGDAIFANGFGGLLFRANNSAAQNVFEVDDTGEVYAVGYSFIADATKLQDTSSGRTVKTYSSQAAQPTLEDTGEAQLVNGAARVALDPGFAATIDRSSYIVLVTPEGMTQGVLCVTQRTPAGFSVQENMGGHSNVSFAYRIVAKPFGSSSPRLPVALVPGRFGQTVPKTRTTPRLYKPAYHAKVMPRNLGVISH